MYWCETAMKTLGLLADVMAAAGFFFGIHINKGNKGLF